ncbi:glycosyltransferase family 4 protein [Thermosynechococcus sp. PP42]|uniref:glycosyltransferase family 4 protein n=1 Tax=Thermosynechococcus sp. PP42 TaxID=3074083 RepID=UPI0028615820|nr:glycosyltransferase family 4 protein [Thermosynechococcus sp. PP42]MDR5638508.1 glycosyltransferase family 4 protein [Thermosynechococcus sp. PP42]
MAEEDAAEGGAPRKEAFKVALISNAAYSVINFRLPLIAELVHRGCTVDVLAPTWSQQERQKVESLGAQCLCYPLERKSLNPLGHLRTFLKLVGIFRTNRYDALLSYTAQANVWGTLAAAWAGVPRRVAMVTGLGYAFTADPEGRSPLKRRVLSWVLTQLYRLAFPLAHRVVVQNPDDLCLLQKICGLPAEKFQLIPGTGVALDEWPMQPAHLQPLTFTMVARLLREKGVMEFLAAARQVKGEYPLIRFCLLGSLDDNPGGLSTADLQPWLEDGTVEWPGAVDVKPWLAQTSVFVLPSYYREGVPRSTQEAMAIGRPVITTDAPGCRETVIDGVNGFLVPPRDVAALANAIRRFIEQPELIPSMGRASRRLAEERFDVGRVNGVLLPLLGVENG